MVLAHYSELEETSKTGAVVNAKQLTQVVVLLKLEERNLVLVQVECWMS